MWKTQPLATMVLGWISAIELQRIAFSFARQGGSCLKNWVSTWGNLVRVLQQWFRARLLVDQDTVQGLNSFNLVSVVSSLIYIFSLAWLATLWNCPLELREGLEAGIYSLQARIKGHRKASMLRSFMVSCSVTWAAGS